MSLSGLHSCVDSLRLVIFRWWVYIFVIFCLGMVGEVLHVFVRFFVLVVFCGIGIWILCCVLGVCCPGVLILLLCAIVVWSFVVVAIGIGTIFDGLVLPICLFWYGVLYLLYFGLFGLMLFGSEGDVFVCILWGWLCVGVCWSYLVVGVVVWGIILRLVVGPP